MNLWIVILLLAICYGSETCDMKKITTFVTKTPWSVLVLVLAFLWMSQRNEGLTSVDDCTWLPFGEDDSWGITFCNGKCQWSSKCPACSDQISSGGCSSMTGCTWDETATTCSDTPPACSDQTSSEDCQSMTGCTWDGTTCADTPPACSDQTSSEDCQSMTGCTWDGTTCADTPPAQTCSDQTTSYDCSGMTGVPQDSLLTCTWDADTNKCSDTPLTCDDFPCFGMRQPSDPLPMDHISEATCCRNECMASFGAVKDGTSCCNQNVKISEDHVAGGFICPASMPTCTGYQTRKHYGTCGPST